MTPFDIFTALVILPIGFAMVGYMVSYETRAYHEAQIHRNARRFGSVVIRRRRNGGWL